MLEEIVAVIADVLNIDPGSLTPDSCREDFATWDSLAHLQIIAEVEGKLGVKIPFEAVSQIRTARDFERFLR